VATTITGLLNQIERDDVVLPAIQRDFVWSESQTAVLLDSLMRGYPIGIALLWETYNDIQYRRFERDIRDGNLVTYRDNPRHKRLRIVLDGQQRLQSLYVALRGKRNGRSVHFDIFSGQGFDDSEEIRYVFDFMGRSEAKAANREEERSIKALDPEEDEAWTPTWWIPASELFAMSSSDQRALVRRLAPRLRLADDDLGLLEENLDRFDGAFTKSEGLLGVTTIDENLTPKSPRRMSETDVLEIFVRINRQGTALSRSDLIFSMLKLNWRESAEGLPEFVAAINKGNSFDLDTDFVVRCLFAVSGLGGKLEIDLLRKQANVERLQESYAHCCEAIKATVDFVTNECQCSSSKLLGSSTTLVPIVAYLYQLPRPEVPNNQVDRVRSAIYLFGLAQPFSRYGESRVGAFVRDASEGEETEPFPLELAIRHVRNWERIESLEDLAESNHALTLHLIQGLSGAQPQYRGNAPELDHIFPRAELRRRGFDEYEVNDLANFWILAKGKNQNKSNRKPRDYFADVSKTQLDKALIDRGLLQNYRQYRRFVRERRSALLRRLGRKVKLTDAMLSRR
jgi:Protein of unknown function DUF262